ncbi:MAG: hypothetical protein JWQ87_2227 [Candidatus Sulfotelmatobacter sp.]|nr:hypothetical protein [Candidatus Sulfotelmatobacter sp.]
MKLRTPTPKFIRQPERFARMVDDLLEGVLRSVDRVMDRPRRKIVKPPAVEVPELISKSA